MKNPQISKALLEAVQAAGRSMTDAAVVRMHSADNEEEITDEKRDELLAKCAAGAYVELDIELMAYEQQTGVRNRNFVRLRDGAMAEMGRTFKGRPCMKDHAHYSMDAVWGTIIKSKSEQVAEGHYKVFQTVRITDPTAVSKALRGLLSTVSISWRSTGDVSCSACNSKIQECWHWPGSKLSEFIGADGKKKFQRDPNGKIVVEWIYNSAEGLEVSFVSVPAVPTAGVDKIRASLSAEHGGDDLSHLTENTDMTIEKDARDEKIARLEKLCTLTDAQRDYYRKLSRDEQDSFLGMNNAQRDSEMSPVWTSADGIKFTKADDSRIIEMAKSMDKERESTRKSLKQANEQNLKARAEKDLAHLAGPIENRVALLSAIDSITDEKIRTEVLASVVEYDGKQSRKFVREGAGGKLTGIQKQSAAESRRGAPTLTVVTNDDDPMERLDAMSEELAEKKGISPALAMAEIMETPEGAKLYKEIEDAKAAE